jgi:hypothetical protein
MGGEGLGLLDKVIDSGIDLLKEIKHETSNDSFVVGLRFEEYVEDLFSKKYFSVAEKTHSTETNVCRGFVLEKILFSRRKDAFD